MKIITPLWSCELVPVVEVSGIHQEYAEPCWGLWALPGGWQLGTLELRALCRRQGWLLLETEFRQAREVVRHEWTPPVSSSSLTNIYCV